MDTDPEAPGSAGEADKQAAGSLERYVGNTIRDLRRARRCKDVAYNCRRPPVRTHPELRQRPLDFDAPSGWTPAQRELSAHLRKRDSRKARMLARLRQGEATTWELMALGGSGWRSRLHELKLDGHPYSCENRLDYAVYRLEAKP